MVVRLIFNLYSCKRVTDEIGTETAKLNEQYRTRMSQKSRVTGEHENLKKAIKVQGGGSQFSLFISTIVAAETDVFDLKATTKPQVPKRPRGGSVARLTNFIGGARAKE